MRSMTASRFCSLESPQPSYCSIETLNFVVKCIYYTKFYNGFILKYQHALLCQVFANWATYMYLSTKPPYVQNQEIKMNTLVVIKSKCVAKASCC